MLNKSALDAEALDSWSGTHITGEGSLIALDQSVAPDPLNININPVNRGYINKSALDGRIEKLGAGDLIAIVQIVAAFGEGEEISIGQTVGKHASGVEILIDQSQITYKSGSGRLIDLPQDVNSTLSGSLIEIEQRVRDLTATTHLEKFGWDAIITLDGHAIDTDQICGEIKVDRSENQAALAEFSIIPPPGTISTVYYMGKRVTIDVQTASGLRRIYTGVVDIPELDLIDKKITFRCTDRRKEQITNQLSVGGDGVTPNGTLLSIGHYSPIIFQSVTDIADELEKRLSTIPYAVDFDVFGNYTFTPWAAKTTPDFTFTDSDVYYEKPKVQLGSRGRVTNTINIKFQYRYNRLHHTQRHWTWRSPIADDVFKLLTYSYTMTFKTSVQSAIKAANWPLKDTITFVPIWPSGWYGGIAWSTVQFSGSTSLVLDAYGDPVLDANGNQTTTTSITGGVDYGPIYCMGASWDATYRWSQVVTESYSLSVRAPQSVSQFGVIDSSESYTSQSQFDPQKWENYKAYTPATQAVRMVSSTASIVGNADGAYYINADTNRGDVNFAAQTVLNKAKTSILGAHRDTKVIVNMFLFPNIDLKHTAKVDTSTLIAKGKVYSIEHVMSVETGEAVTTVTLALSKTTGSSSNSSLALPHITADGADPSTSTITLGNHFGEDPSTEAAQTWNGMIGNRFFPGGIFRTTYPEQFRVDTPAIQDSIRQERKVSGAANYNVAIPDDLLTIIF